MPEMMMSPWALLVITIGIELPIYACFFKSACQTWTTWVGWLAMNVLTWSGAMWLYGYGFTDFYSTELGVIAAETVFLKYGLASSWKKAGLAASVANLITASLSFVL